MLETEEERQRAEELKTECEDLKDTRGRAIKDSSAFDIEEAQKTIRESIEPDSITILGRDHPMFDESIDQTPKQYCSANFKLAKYQPSATALNPLTTESKKGVALL